jgi:hypothetical protein
LLDRGFSAKQPAIASLTGIIHISQRFGGASRVSSNSRGVVSHANDRKKKESEEGQEGRAEGEEDQEAP